MRCKERIDEEKRGREEPGGSVREGRVVRRYRQDYGREGRTRRGKGRDGTGEGK